MKNIGMILLAIWLIAQGLIQFISFNFNGRAEVMAGLGIAAGILIILKR